MKKRVKSLIMCLASIVGIGTMATGCEQLGQILDPHEHSYSETWMSDAEGHWHEATCDCEDVVPEKEAHVDANNDGVCDVCSFTDHEHTYSEDWSSDENKHWHEADCGHDVDVADEAAHVDADENNECDVCGYVDGEIHVHTYSSDWSYDEEYHWHAPSCGHEVEVSGKAPHNLNEAGDCTICLNHIVDINTVDIESVLAAAMANENKIKSGHVVETNVVYGSSGQTVETGKVADVSFELGAGVSYIKWDSYDLQENLLGSEEQWHQALSEEEFFGVKLVSGEEKKTVISSGAQFLKGYSYFSGSILGAAEDDTSTLANTFMGLYNKMKAGVRVSDAEEGYDEETENYEFAYTYYSVNPVTTGGVVFSVEIELYNVAVTFKVNEDMIINEANFYVEVYRDYEADQDLSYDYVDNGNGTVTISNLQLAETADPTRYIYQVTQESGTRTYVNPYVKENMIPTSFDFTYVTSFEWNEDYTEMINIQETAIGESIEIQEGEYAKFRISNFLPATSDPSFLNSSDFEYSFVNKDDNSTAECWYASDSFLNTYSASSQMLKLKIRDVGEYTVTIKFGELTKVFDIIVVGEQAIEPGEDDANTMNVQTTDTYTYDDLYSYTAAESGTYTFTLPAGLGFYSKESYDSWSDPEFDVFNPSADTTVSHTVSFELAAGETLEFYVGAMTTANWAITISFEAGEVGGSTEVVETDLVIGNNAIEAADVTYAYTATEAGTLTLTAGAAIMGMVEISYTVNGGTSTVLELSSTVDLVLAAGDKVVITVVAEGYSTLTAAWAGGEGGEGGESQDPTAVDATIVAGTNNLTIAEGTYITSSVYGLIGNYTVTWDVASVTVKFNGIEIENGCTITSSSPMLSNVFEIYGDNYAAVSTLTLTVAEVVVPATPIVLGDNTVSVTDTYNGTTVEFTATEADTYSFAAGENAVLGFDYSNYYSGEFFTVELSANESVSFVVLTEDYLEGDVVVTVAKFEGGSEGGEEEIVYGSQENPYELTVGESELTITQALVDSYYVYCTMAITETGWYSFNEYWSCSGDNAMLENSNGVWFYAEAGTTLSVYKYVETVGTLVVTTAKESVNAQAAGNGDSVENAIAIAGVGSYAISADYDVCADGVYVSFTAAESGYYTFNFSNFSNILTYNNASYCSNDNGDLILYAEAGVSYVMLLDNIGYDDNWVAVETSGTFFFNVTSIPALTVGENTVVGTGESSAMIVITVETSGTYTISIEEKEAESIYLYGDISIGGYNPYGTSSYSVVATLEAGQIYTTTVYFPDDSETWSPMSGNWTISIVEGGSTEVVENDLVLGNNAINAADVTYAYTATEAGTLTLTAGGAVGGMVEISYTVNDGESTVLELSSTVNLELVAGDKVVITVVAEGYSSITAAWVGESEENTTDLVIGNNAINAADVTYAYTATGNGTLTLTAGAAISGMVEISYTVNDGASTVLELSSTVDLELAAGDKVVITVVAEGYSTITAAWAVEPDGTEDYPYVIDELPADLTVNYEGNGAAGMVWYTFTVETSGTFTITFDGTDNWFFVNQGTTQVFSGGSAAQLSYTTSLSAGEYKLGIATWSESAATLQVNVAFEVVSAGGETPDEGGVVVYLGANGSGRAMQITVDAAAGTVSVIRAALAGNSLDTSTGATEYVGTYSYDGSTVTCTISGCTITWNADGSPESVVWGSATYTGFTVQA